MPLQILPHVKLLNRGQIAQKILSFALALLHHNGIDNGYTVQRSIAMPRITGLSVQSVRILSADQVTIFLQHLHRLI